VKNFLTGDLSGLINCGAKTPAKQMIPNIRLSVKTPSAGKIAPNHEVIIIIKTPTIGLKKDKPQIIIARVITRGLLILKTPGT